MSAFDGEGFDDQDFEEVLKRFEEMLSTGKHGFFDADELEEIIDYYFQWANYEMAKKAIDFGLQQFPFSSLLKIKQAQYLSSQHFTQEALSLLNDIEQIESQNFDLFMTRGYIYSQMGLGEQAIENFKKALPLAEFKDEVYLALGVEFLNESKPDDALFYLKKAIRSNPKNEVALNELSLCFDLTGKSEEAISFFLDYIDEFPYSYYAWFNLGVAYNRFGLYEKAIEAYDFSLAINDKFGSAYFNKANSLAQLGRYQEAIEIYKETFKHESQDASTYYYIGECHENLNQFEEALVNYNKCVKLDPTHADAWLAIGVCLDALNRLTEGIHYVKKAIEINPNEADYWYVFAEVQQKLGFQEEAAMAYQRVIELDYPEEDVWLDYARLLDEAGYYKDCIETLAEGIKHFPESAELHYRFSIILMETGKRNEGLEHFNKGLELDYNKHSAAFEYAPALQYDKDVLQLINSYKH
jgi:tetratricopeptide (TPR) repeat protein